MSTVEERLEYIKYQGFGETSERLYGDFTPFYITIAICTFFGIFIFGLNLICGCCSKNKSYWNDRHTGNRWLVTIFTSTAHKQPPLDLEELGEVHIDYPKSYPGEIETQELYEAKETQKTRRAFGSPFHHQRQQPTVEYTQVAHQQPAAPQKPPVFEEFVELQKKESAI